MRGGIKMAIDFSRLSGRIVEKFGTQLEFARAMGLSEKTISFKLNNVVPWKVPEIIKAAQLLDIKDDEVYEYFFMQKVNLS